MRFVDASELRRRVEAEGIERTFFVCSAQRSGSTMLCEMLAATRLVGRAREYFGPYFTHSGNSPHSPAFFDQYLLEAVKRGSKNTRAFGVKLHRDQLDLFLRLLRSRRGIRGSSDRELFELIFPRPCFLWMTRDDTLAQAISWWKAQATGVWYDHHAPQADPRFDFGEISARLRDIRRSTDGWRRWFAENAIEPLPVVYEELAADPTEVVRGALAFIGVDVPARLAVEPQTRKQADDVNKDWVRRYKERARLRTN